MIQFDDCAYFSDGLVKNHQLGLVLQNQLYISYLDVLLEVSKRLGSVGYKL